MSRAEDHSIALDRRRYHAYLERRGLKSSQLANLDVLIGGHRRAFVLRYRYGDPIAQAGRFCPPCLDPECAVCRQVDSAFTVYQGSIPLALVSRNTVEVFIDAPGPAKRAKPWEWRSRPARMMGPGELFGVFETLDALYDGNTHSGTWNVVAGARSIALLLTRRTRLRGWLTKQIQAGRVSRSELDQRLSALASDDWELVKFLAQRVGDAADHEASETEVIVFPPFKSRPSRTEHQKRLQALAELGGVGWVQSKALRLQATDSIELASMPYLREANLPAGDRVALLGTVQQVLAAGRGDLPVFVAANRIGLSSVPMAAVQRCVKDVFKTDQALLLHPHHLRQPGDTGFISIRANCLPAISAVKPRIVEEFCNHVAACLDEVASSNLDLTKFEHLNGRQAVFELLQVPHDSIDLERAGIPTKHRFLTGCLRIVRAS